MLEPGGKLDLPEKPLSAKRCGQFRVKNLEGHRSVVANVPRKIDRSHAPAAELPLDRVARLEIRLQSLADVGHKAPALGFVGLGFCQVVA